MLGAKHYAGFHHARLGYAENYNAVCHNYKRCKSCNAVIMLLVIMPIVISLSVIMLSVVMLNFTLLAILLMLSVVMLSFNILKVSMLSVICWHVYLY